MASFADGIGAGIDGVFKLAGCLLAFSLAAAVVIAGLVIYIAVR